MRQQLTGVDNTPTGSKAARERLLYEKNGKLKTNPPIVTIGYNHHGYYLDIIGNSNNVVKFPPQLRKI